VKKEVKAKEVKEANKAVKETPEIGEYNGKPILVLNPLSRFPTQFGVTKARRILSNIRVIEDFVKKYGNDAEE
jgi:hypothetical protein